MVIKCLSWIMILGEINLSTIFHFPNLYRFVLSFSLCNSVNNHCLDESANGSSSSNADSSVESGSRKSGSVSSSHPPPSKKALISPSEHLVQSDFSATISPSQNRNRPFVSKNAVYITQSQTSLVSYGEQEDEEDQFAKGLHIGGISKMLI